jgi:hypothetical protein
MRNVAQKYTSIRLLTKFENDITFKTLQRRIMYMANDIFGMKSSKFDFSDEEIAKLFGNETAEDEDPQRLREYYFKNDLYNQISARLPLRILVGHKGIGKSAMFQVLRIESESHNELTVSITPDDITGISESIEDMLELIRIWKNGLKEIIATKAVQQLGNNIAPLKNITDSIVNVVFNILNNAGFDLRDEKENIVFKFLESKKITVFIDDLDRGWEGKKSDIRRVSAMLNAVRDLARENKDIFFKVSLRTDVYYLYRESDESTDKVEGSVVWLAWTNFELLALLCKRIITYFNGNVTEDELLSKKQNELSPILNKVFLNSFEGSGAWERIPTYRLLTSLIRKRPRDLVKLCTLAGKEARKNNSTRIGTREFNAIFLYYSSGRLKDTYIEYRSELPDIQKLLTNMKPSKEDRKEKIGFLYTNDRLYKKVANILQNHNLKFTNDKEKATVKALCAFMYKINFLIGRKDVPNRILRIYFEEHNYLLNDFSDFGFNWEVHPAYRWALQPDDVLNIIPSIPIYEDE